MLQHMAFQSNQIRTCRPHRCKVQCGQPTRRIVDENGQGAPRSTRLEPVMQAPVDLDQLTEAGRPLAQSKDFLVPPSLRLPDAEFDLQRRTVSRLIWIPSRSNSFSAAKVGPKSRYVPHRRSTTRAPIPAARWRFEGRPRCRDTRPASPCRRYARTRRFTCRTPSPKRSATAPCESLPPAACATRTNRSRSAALIANIPAAVKPPLHHTGDIPILLKGTFLLCANSRFLRVDLALDGNYGPRRDMRDVRRSADRG